MPEGRSGRAEDLASIWIIGANMNVGELIDDLKKLDPSLPVLVQGYEGGACDLQRVFLASAELNIHTGDEAWIFGPHEIDDIDGGVPVVYLPRSY